MTLKQLSPRQKTIVFIRLAGITLGLALLVVLGFKYRTSSCTEPVLSLKINEICVANPGTPVSHGVTYQNYLELYNPTRKTISLAGLRIGTDSETSDMLLMGEIAPHGYTCIYALSGDAPAPEGSLSISLDLSNAKTVTVTWEEITVLTTLKTEPALPVDSVTLPASLTAGTVYARTEDGGDDFAELRPTPGSSNTEATRLLSEQPVIETPSGFYQNSVTVSMSVPDGLTIRYTLDGSVPDETSPVYDGSLTFTDPSSQPNVYSARTDIAAEATAYLPPTEAVDKAVVFRAAAFDADGNQSNPVTATYFINLDRKGGCQNAWIVSLISEPDNLFSDERGIYVRGSVYEQALQDGVIYEEFPWIDLMDYMNYHREGSESERRAQLTIFDSESTVRIDQECGIRIRGNASRSFPQKSFTLFARKRYGNNTFASVFSDPDETYPTLILNNSRTLAKTFFFRLADDRDTAGQEYRPCQLFLNGEYWGMYYLMEKYSAEYLENHYQVPASDILLIKDSEEIQSGNTEDYACWQEVLDLFRTDLSVPDNYIALLGKVDIQSLIDWLCTNIYIANTDTRPLGGNVYTWRSIRPTGEDYNDGKWRWILYDLDDALAVGTEYENNEPWKMDAFTDHAGYYPAGLLDTEPLPNLMQNEDFRRQFVQTFLDMTNENFDADRVSTLLDEQKASTSDQAAISWQRWNAELWYDTYDAQIETLRTYFENRREVVLAQLADHFDLNGELVDITLGVRTEGGEDKPGGTVTLNTITPDLTTSNWTGQYYTDYPVSLRVLHAKGYRFVRWEIENGEIVSGDSEHKEIDVQLHGDTRVTAVFEKK